MALALGKKRVDLPADEYGLDEDGWVEVRTRVSARDYQRANEPGSGPLGALCGMVTDWQLKIDGEDVPYDPEGAFDLPLEIIYAAVDVIDTSPLVAKSSAQTNGQNGSNGSTAKPKQAGNRAQRRAKPTSSASAGK